MAKFSTTLVSLEDLPKAAAQLLQLGQRKMAFYGDLGAGKTTLVKAICQALGVSDATGSPTFSIINVYAGAATEVFHLDLYRLQSAEEAIAIGVLDLLENEEAYIFIEWPELLEPFLDDSVLRIKLQLLEDDTRQLEVF